MYVDAPWQPALDACLVLAKRYKTVIVDANIEASCHYEVVSQGVDCIRYVPRVALVPGTGEPAVTVELRGITGNPDFSPKGFSAALPDTFDTLLGIQGPHQEEAAQTFLERKPVHHTIAYELVRKKNEDEEDGEEGEQQHQSWLYDQPQDE